MKKKSQGLEGNHSSQTTQGSLKKHTKKARKSKRNQSKKSIKSENPKMSGKK